MGSADRAHDVAVQRAKIERKKKAAQSRGVSLEHDVALKDDELRLAKAQARVDAVQTRRTIRTHRKRSVDSLRVWRHFSRRFPTTPSIITDAVCRQPKTSIDVHQPVLWFYLSAPVGMTCFDFLLLEILFFAFYFFSLLTCSSSSHPHPCVVSGEPNTLQFYDVVHDKHLSEVAVSDALLAPRASPL